MQNNQSFAAAVMALDCLCSADIVYASTPITGGKARLDGHPDFLEFNIQEAGKFAKFVNRLSGKPVINPACLIMESWEQATYIELWKIVIKSKASEIWVNDGWQYSNGCALELAYAFCLGKKILDSNGFLLKMDTAISLLREAIPLLQVSGLGYSGVRYALEEMEGIKRI